MYCIVASNGCMVIYAVYCKFVLLCQLLNCDKGQWYGPLWSRVCNCQSSVCPLWPSWYVTGLLCRRLAVQVPLEPVKFLLFIVKFLLFIVTLVSQDADGALCFLVICFWRRNSHFIFLIHHVTVLTPLIATNIVSKAILFPHRCEYLFMMFQSFFCSLLVIFW